MAAKKPAYDIAIQVELKFSKTNKAVVTIEYTFDRDNDTDINTVVDWIEVDGLSDAVLDADKKILNLKDLKAALKAKQKEWAKEDGES